MLNSIDGRLVFILFFVALFCLGIIAKIISARSKNRKAREDEQRAARIMTVEGEITDLKRSGVEVGLTLKSYQNSVFVASSGCLPTLNYLVIGDDVRIQFIFPEDGGVVMNDCISFVPLQSKKMKEHIEAERLSRKITVEGTIADLRRSDDEVLITLKACGYWAFIAHRARFPILDYSQVGDVVRIEFITPRQGKHVVMEDLVSFVNIIEEAEELREALKGLDDTIFEMGLGKSVAQVVETELGSEPYDNIEIFH